MRLLIIADPRIAVPPRAYGGTERIVALQAQALAEAGNRVRLLAAIGSKDFGGGLWVHRAPTLARSSRIFRKAWFQIIAWLASIRCDAVINFGRGDYLHSVFCRKVPLVLWFQNPVTQRDVDYYNARRSRSRCMVFLSRSQCQGLSNLGPTRVVPNATNTNFFVPGGSPLSERYAVFLGRLTANKGVHLAIAAAREAGVHLKIAGNVSKEPGGEAYFSEQIKPRLGNGCEWVGEVDDGAKRSLLQGAVALLFPIQWDEPFGIVMIESLACGTPIIAFRRGSTPEIIEHGRTGFLCDTVEEMVEHLRNIYSVDRQDCRRAAEERFSAQALLKNTLQAINAAAGDTGEPK